MAKRKLTEAVLIKAIEKEFDPRIKKVQKKPKIESKDKPITIIITGEVTHGYSFIGPFDSFETAVEWADKELHGSPWSWIVTLVQKPDQYLKLQEED